MPDPSPYRVRPDLSLIESEDLVKELFTRCDAAVIVLAYRELHGKQSTTVRHETHGAAHWTLGLAVDAATLIQHEIAADRAESQRDDG